MIRFYLKWLQVLGISPDNITLRLTINNSYRNKEANIKNYWSKLTGIPLTQFTKTFFQTTQWKKQYSNQDYFGVLRVHVKGSLQQLLLMRGWINGIKSNV